MNDNVPTLGCYRITGSPLPEYATENSACFDISARFDPSSKVKLYTASNKEMSLIPLFSSMENKLFITIKPGDRVLIPTGIIFDIPTGYSLRVYIRSSIALKKGLILSNSEGVIDSDYFHETFVMVTNVSTQSVVIFDGDRIAQGELVPVYNVNIQDIPEAPKQKTDRIGGLGSTGV